MKAFHKALDKLCMAWSIADAEKDNFVVDVITQLNFFRNKIAVTDDAGRVISDIFTKSYIWEHAKRPSFSTAAWWEMYGVGTPQLQMVGIAFGNLKGGASPCERNCA